MNVADQITDVALEYPYKRSVIMPVNKSSLGVTRYEHYTFIQLEKRINQLSNALIELGVKKSDRVLLFVKPGLDFSALTFALFKIGAIAVLIDPGMGLKKFLAAIKEVDAQVLIGIPKVHLLRRIIRKPFQNISLFITTSRLGLFTSSIVKQAPLMNYSFDAVDMQPMDQAAILFTSGGTGKPKGVVYTHDIFIQQTQMLKQEFSLTHQDVDIPGFPLFALFTLAMGMASCIPEMDPSRPAKADPKKLVTNIFDQGATFIAGSPAIWTKVADYCIKNKLTLPSVESLVMFGAPIPINLHEKFKRILPNGTTYTPYGATECLPVSNISGSEILKSFKTKMLEGKGTCVGLPLDQVQVEIIALNNEPIHSIDHTAFLPPYEVGEIIVHSPVVTPMYFRLPDKTALAKIKDKDSIWHRMGDVGYKDEKGRLWFCGRKTHVINEDSHQHFTIPVESIFNQHPQVLRSALVSVNSRAALVVERKDKKTKISKEKRDLFFSELIELGARFEHTKDIHDIFLYKNFPVDVRHNIKIDRNKLSIWANEQRQ